MWVACWAIMTEASQQALTRLRDLSTLQWYVIPLLAVAGIWAVAIVVNVIGLGVLGWRY